MKIVIVSDAIYPYNKGGKEKRIFELSKRYVAAGHEVHIVTMLWWKGGRAIREQGMTLHGVCSLQPLYTSEGRRSLREAIIFGLAVFWSLLWIPADLFEVDHIPYIPLFPARLVAWIRRKPLFATWHEVWGRNAWKSYLGGWKALLASVIEWFALRMPDRIISVSPLTTKRLVNELGVTEQKIITIPNGISLDDIDQVKPAKEKSELIFAGRLLRHKNIDVALHALARLKKDKGLTPTFFVIGDGPERGELERLSKKLGLEKQVRFWGFLEDEKQVYGLMKASRVCLCPSSREGFGILALEANACGLPVLTVDEPENAMQNLIEQGKNGVVTSLNGQKLAGALEQMLYSLGESERIKREAQQHASSSDWAILTERVLNYYSDQQRTMPVLGIKKKDWWSVLDQKIFLGLCLFAFVLALGFIQDGSFYSSDGHHYFEYAQHFIQGDFDLSNTTHPNFPSTYPLLASPMVYFIHNLDVGVAFAFRAVNILFFSLTIGLTYLLARLLGVRRGYAALAGVLMMITPALPIAIDLWPQSLSVFGGTAFTVLTFIFFQRRNLLIFLLSAFAFAIILYIRTFEIVFYFPHLLLLFFGSIHYVRQKTTKYLGGVLRMMSLGFGWASLLFILILPLILFNVKNYQTAFGYYYSDASQEAHHFNFKMSNLLPHAKELIFNFTVDRPDLPAHRPTLAILESTPVLILSVFGWLLLFRRSAILALTIGWTILSGLAFYAAFSNWSDPFTPSMRFLLVIFPSLCILAALGLDRILHRMKKYGAAFGGIAAMILLSLASLILAPDFFDRLIFTNIGIWSNRSEIKNLAHFIYVPLFVLILIWAGVELLSKRTSLLIIKDFLKGLMLGFVGLSFLHSIYANVISAALSIRYGENVFSYFYFPFLRYIDLEFRRTIGPHIKFLFWLPVFLFVYILSSILFFKVKAWYEKKDTHRHSVLSSGRRGA